MGHLPELIRDLALILISGAVVSLLFRRIKQPLVLGYIIAGFLVGPYLSLFPTVADSENIKTLADIGVIFLLFSLGLEFSFKKLFRVGGTATITAFVEILFIIITGYITGKLLGWSAVDSLFLGGMLASSSTTIIIRAFDELGIKTKQYVKVVFGVLVVEDIVVVLLMVLLPMIAVSKHFEGSRLLLAMLKLIFFLAVWYMGGIYLIPTLLKRVKKFLNEETLLVIAVGLCLGMVVIGTGVGFSAELGAFIMGSIIAESIVAEKVEHLIKPVKDLFATIFFVSIGMLIDPALIARHWFAVIAVTSLTIFGKFISTLSGALLSGQTLKQSVHVGMSMAQIGEFAFIVAALGLSLGVISDYLFPVAVGASAITTFTTPYMIKYSDNIYNLMEKVLPRSWINALNNYSSSSQTLQSESRWKRVVKAFMYIALTNSIIIIALFLVVVNLLIPLLENYFGDHFLAGSAGLLLALAAASPFLWALMVKRPKTMAYRELWINSRYNHGPLVVLEIIRITIGVFLIGFLVEKIFSTIISLFVIIPLIMIFFLVFSKRIQKTYQHIEMRFMANLNARERAAAEANVLSNYPSPKKYTPKLKLDIWDAHIEEFEVLPDAEFAGLPLEQLSWRERYGINILYIKRGSKIIYVAGSSTLLYPYDVIGIVGTDEQVQQIAILFSATPDTRGTEEISADEIIISKILVSELNDLAGRTIRESCIKERTGGLVVGIERGGERILNPVSSVKFLKGDIIWLAGERSKLKKLE
jgi:CPA2 family monovalent cation:H+ antiporter-2